VAEQPGDAALAGELGGDRAPALAGSEQRERGRDGRLADPALAGDDHELALEK
jgi:hypothetical protein